MPFTTKDLHRISQTLYMTVATATIRCGLRLSATTDYVVPRTLSKFSERAFAHAGPAAWNRLPDQIRRQSTPTTFRRHLKTFSYSLKLLTLPRTFNIVMSTGQLCIASVYRV